MVFGALQGLMVAPLEGLSRNLVTSHWLSHGILKSKPRHLVLGLEQKAKGGGSQISNCLAVAPSTLIHSFINIYIYL